MKNIIAKVVGAVHTYTHTCNLINKKTSIKNALLNIYKTDRLLI